MMIADILPGMRGASTSSMGIGLAATKLVILTPCTRCVYGRSYFQAE